MGCADAKRVAHRVVTWARTAEGARRHKPVHTGLVKLDENAEARHAGDATGKFHADMSGEIGCGLTVHGIALGGDGAPLGARDMSAQASELRVRAG